MEQKRADLKFLFTVRALLACVGWLFSDVFAFLAIVFVVALIDVSEKFLYGEYTVVERSAEWLNDMITDTLLLLRMLNFLPAPMREFFSFATIVYLVGKVTDVIQVLVGYKYFVIAFKPSYPMRAVAFFVAVLGPAGDLLNFLFTFIVVTGDILNWLIEYSLHANIPIVSYAGEEITLDVKNALLALASMVVKTLMYCMYVVTHTVLAILPYLFAILILGLVL